MTLCKFYEFDYECRGRVILVFAFGLGPLLCIEFVFDSGVVESGGLLLKLFALVNVKNRVDLLACSVWAMRCIALLWRDILRPFMCGFSHVERGGLATCLCHY